MSGMGELSEEGGEEIKRKMKVAGLVMKKL